MSNNLQLLIILLICTTACFSKELAGKFKDSETVVLDGQLTGKIDETSLNQFTKLLSVSFNSIVSIDKNDLRNAPSLEVFVMNNNVDYKLPKDEVFLVHQNLQNVSLDSCRIIAVYQETFSQLPNLTTLSMNHNNIQTLVGPIFAKNLKLQFLFVNSNNIKTITPNLLNYVGQFAFKELQMNFNPNFNFVENQEFLINKNLTSYECEYCNVTRIDQRTFSKLPNLTRLILNHNNISHITIKSFHQNGAIQVLMLNNNSLIEVPLDIFSIKSLSIFQIDLNKFVPSIDNNLLKKNYMSKPYRSPDSPIAKSDYFENVLEDFIIPTTATTTVPPTRTTKPSRVDDICKEQDVPISKEGISDAFISTYLTLIIVLQIVVLVLTISCWIKKSRDESSEYIDYSKTVLNEHDIYKTN